MSGSRSDARRPAGGAGGCAIHLVRFSAYSEGGCPVAGGGGLAATMADLLVALGPGGCGREVATPGFGHEQVALPVEDVIVTSNHTLFDQDGYLTRVCAMHAEFLRLHAVAPRACHGPQCRNRAAPGLAQARRVSGFGSGEDPDGVGLCRRWPPGYVGSDGERRVRPPRARVSAREERRTGPRASRRFRVRGEGADADARSSRRGSSSERDPRKCGARRVTDSFLCCAVPCRYRCVVVRCREAVPREVDVAVAAAPQETRPAGARESRQVAAAARGLRLRFGVRGCRAGASFASRGARGRRGSPLYQIHLGHSR